MPARPGQRLKSNRKSCKKFCRYFYNRETHKCCGRSCKNWCAVVCYYFIFAIIAFAFFIAVILTFVSTDSATPSVPLLSLAGSPGSSVIPSSSAKLGNPIIYYSKRSGSEYYYGQAVRDIKWYMKEQSHIDLESGINRNDSNYFNTSMFGKCSSPDYGYPEGEPCIFLKLNKLKHWKPGYYHRIPSHLPADVRKVIDTGRACVWINCKGNSAFDEDHIKRIKYYPEQAFQEGYFSTTTPTETNPTVAIKMKGLQVGTLTSVMCSFYAPNYSKEGMLIHVLVLD